jgi:c-di-GMP-binding flagellar brake protein YcgR
MIGSKAARERGSEAARRIEYERTRGPAKGFRFARRMSEQPQHDSERRRYPRLKAKIPVEIRCTNSAPMRTSTDEVSLCGCYIETMFTMEVGTRLSLVFSCEDQKIATNAVVATKYPQVGNGIDFIDMAPEDRLKLGEFLAQLGA